MTMTRSEAAALGRAARRRNADLRLIADLRKRGWELVPGKDQAAAFRAMRSIAAQLFPDSCENCGWLPGVDR